MSRGEEEKGEKVDCRGQVCDRSEACRQGEHEGHDRGKDRERAVDGPRPGDQGGIPLPQEPHADREGDSHGNSEGNEGDEYGGEAERPLRAGFPNTLAYPDHALLPRTLLAAGMHPRQLFARNQFLLLQHAALANPSYDYLAWVDMAALPHPVCPQAEPDFSALLDNLKASIRSLKVAGSGYYFVLRSDPAAYGRMARARNPYGDGQAARRIANRLVGEARTSKAICT